MPLFKKCEEYVYIRELVDKGIYPYFHELESKQDIEVMMEGERRIMLGSNNYLGLTVNQEVIDAGVEAMKKYGTGCSGSARSSQQAGARIGRFFGHRGLRNVFNGLSIQSWHNQRHLRPAGLYFQRPRKPRQHLRRLQIKLCKGYALSP